MSKNKLDFNLPIRKLDGSNFKELDSNGNETTVDVSLSKTLANALSQAQSKDSMKVWDWAMSLYKGEVLELDDSDVSTLKEIVNTLQMQNIVKGQILKVFK